MERSAIDRLSSAFCEAYFSPECTLKGQLNHERSMEGFESNRISCSLCDRQFSTKYSLDKHVKVNHEKSMNSYECQICSLTGATLCSTSSLNSNTSDELFTNKDRLRHHVYQLIHNSGNKITNCDICGKEFASAKYLKYHIEEDKDGEKLRIQCKLCIASFKTGRYLNKHVKNVHANGNLKSDGVKCPFCKSLQSDLIKLRRHLNIHHNIKLEKPIEMV